MNPVDTAQAVVPLIERGGVVAAVIVFATLAIFGLTASLVVVWKSREAAVSKYEAAINKLQEAQASHYKWALGEVERKSEIERSLSAQLAAVRTVSEIMGASATRQRSENSNG